MHRALMLDTCALLWLGNSSESLSSSAIEEIESASILYASTISLWEIAWKCSLGNLKLAVSPQEWFDILKTEYGIALLPIDESIALKAAEMPFYHRDPADRFIIATALLKKLTVVTKDRRYAEYGVETIS